MGWSKPDPSLSVLDAFPDAAPAGSDVKVTVLVKNLTRAGAAEDWWIKLTRSDPAECLDARDVAYADRGMNRAEISGTVTLPNAGAYAVIAGWGGAQADDGAFASVSDPFTAT